MVLTSALYLAFLVVLLVLYYLLPKKMQWPLLLIFSFLFIIYATSDIKVYFYIAYGALVTYIGARLIDSAKDEKKKNKIKVITILLTLVQLVFLKYLNFFTTTAASIVNLFGAELQLPSLTIIAPIGVSFYTLISIGYVIDVARGTVACQKNIFKYLLYVLYFPQITSGPITRYSEMQEQLYAEHKFDFNNVCYGFQRIIWGILKKIIIAERMAIIVNTIFDNYTQYPGIYVLIGAVAFAVQLYSDFSGCMDIVLGSSETLGIRLPENFDTPFFSRNISEYWRRWHITLGTWFKDYYFYPILKSEKFQKFQEFCKKKFGKKWGKKLATYCGMFILWFTVGFWHGGNFTFIIGSGILHWFYIVFGEILSPLFDKIGKICRTNRERFTYKVFEMIRTFSLVCLGFIFFRAPNVSQAIEMIKNIFVNNYTNPIVGLGLQKNDYIIALGGVLLLFIISILKQKFKIRESIAKQHILVRYAIWIGLIAFILIFGYYGTGYNSAAFIYQNF